MEQIMKLQNWKEGWQFNFSCVQLNWTKRSKEYPHHSYGLRIFHKGKHLVDFYL